MNLSWGANKMSTREDYQAAAKLIRDWGCEGVESAARFVGEDAARGMASDHVRSNVQETFPGADIRGDETTEEIQRKITNYERKRIEDKLTTEQLNEVRKAEATLRRYNLYKA